jgi:RNA recognition motif-containing protein
LFKQRERFVSKKLYVGNLPYNTTVEDLRSLFEEAGEIVSVTVITDRETGRSKGFGFVEMADEGGAEEAIKRFNGWSLDSRVLTVNEARPREERPRYGGGGGGGRDRGGYGGGGGGNRGGGGYRDRDQDNY